MINYSSKRFIMFQNKESEGNDSKESVILETSDSYNQIFGDDLK